YGPAARLVVVAHHRHHAVLRSERCQHRHEVLRPQVGPTGDEVSGDGYKVGLLVIDSGGHFCETLAGHPAAHMDVAYLRYAVPVEGGRQTRQLQPDGLDVNPARLDVARVVHAAHAHQGRPCRESQCSSEELPARQLALHHDYYSSDYFGEV